MKLNRMSITNYHHEILLLTGSHFANREFCSREESPVGPDKMTTREKLEKACWDGLLYELLPEVFDCPIAGSRHFIWHILSGKNFLYISIGPNPVAIVQEASIDPYYFLSPVNEN